MAKHAPAARRPPVYAVLERPLLNRIKHDIVAYLAETGADVGHVFPVRSFFLTRAKGYTPPEVDAIEAALDSLEEEGALDKRGDQYFVTDAGVQRLYPGGMAQAVTKVRDDMLRFLRSQNAREGHILAAQPFFAQYAMRYGPLEKRAITDAAASLVEEDVLEERAGGHFLTAAGYASLYRG